MTTHVWPGEQGDVTIKNQRAGIEFPDPGLSRGDLDSIAVQQKVDVDSQLKIIIAIERQSIRTMIRNIVEPEFNILASVGSADELINLLQRSEPDVVLMDMAMTCSNGLTAGCLMRRHWPKVAVAYLTSDADKAQAAPIRQEQGGGYWLCLDPFFAFMRTLRSLGAAQGDGPADSLAAQPGAPVVGRADTSWAAAISSREADVLTLIARGQSMKQVARLLQISPRTVAFHKYNAMRRLSLKGNSALINFAAHNGMLDDD